MAVRVPLRLQSTVLGERSSVRVVAVVNTGFETEGPELLLPAPCAAMLGLYPQPPPGVRAERYETAGGSATFWRVPRGVSLALEDEATTDAQQTTSPQLVADVLISEADHEVLLNDVIAGDLGIVILNARTGDWRLAGDEPHRIRRSLGRQRW